VTGDSTTATDGGSAAADSTAAADTGSAAKDSGGAVNDAGSATDADSATDAGSAADGSGCGAITSAGKCKGNILQYCDEGTLAEDDCAAMMAELGKGVCIEVAKDWGSECALEAGGTCLSEGEDGEYVWEFCSGDKAACVETTEGDVCKVGVATCKDSDIGKCLGDLGVLDCAGGVPWVVDCKAAGGKCAVEGEAVVCTGIAADGECDDDQYRCATDLKCEGATDEAWGSCTKK